MLDPVAITGLLVAAIRAEETRRADPLFTDPFADRLAGAAGRETLAAYRAATGVSVPIIEVRTRYYDDTIASVLDTTDIRQFVILAAGMDSRAYRLTWPPGARVFEVDQPAVLAHKTTILAADQPTCERFTVPVDLAADWPSPLISAGFDPDHKTCWLVEGLLQYLDEPIVTALFARIDDLSAPGSRLIYDVIGQVLLNAPFMAAATKMMRDHGAPWTFGTDDPAALVAADWLAAVSDTASTGIRLGRWPMPVAPPPGGPRGYLVTAAKQ